MRSRGFKTSHSQRNVMGQSTERSPLVAMLFQAFLNLLKFLMEIINILGYITAVNKKINISKKHNVA